MATVKGMDMEERFEAALARCSEFFDRVPEDQTNELYQAYRDVADVLYRLREVEREIHRVKAQSDERAARAWDKGYGAGHHDGRWHDTMRLSSTPRIDRGRRNPYRFSGGAGCGCHGSDD
ncbi:MAG: hypothetical protein ACTHJM_01115 [Marmoricola sp.]